MRLTDHQANPILSTCLAWFGGGAKGPSDAEKAAAAKQMKDAEDRANAQQAMMQKQMREQELAAANQKYNGQLAMGKMEASKAAPGIKWTRMRQTIKAQPRSAGGECAEAYLPGNPTRWHTTPASSPRSASFD